MALPYLLCITCWWTFQLFPIFCCWTHSIRNILLLSPDAHVWMQCLGVELPRWRLCKPPTLPATATLFSKVAASVYTHRQCKRVPVAPPPPTTWNGQTLKLSPTRCERRECLIGLKNLLSLIINEVVHLFLVCLQFGSLFWANINNSLIVCPPGRFVDAVRAETRLFLLTVVLPAPSPRPGWSIGGTRRIKQIKVGNGWSKTILLFHCFAGNQPRSLIINNDQLRGPHISSLVSPSVYQNNIVLITLP